MKNKRFFWVLFFLSIASFSRGQTQGELLQKKQRLNDEIDIINKRLKQAEENKKKELTKLLSYRKELLKDSLQLTSIVQEIKKTEISIDSLQLLGRDLKKKEDEVRFQIEKKKDQISKLEDLYKNAIKELYFSKNKDNGKKTKY